MLTHSSSRSSPRQGKGHNPDNEVALKRGRLLPVLIARQLFRNSAFPHKPLQVLHFNGSLPTCLQSPLRGCLCTWVKPSSWGWGVAPPLSSGTSYTLTNSHSSPVPVSDQRSLPWCWQQLCLVRLAEEGHVRARTPARSVLFAGRCRRQD